MTSLFGSLLGFNSSLLTHSRKNNDIGIFLLSGEELLDLLANLALGNLDIILGLTIVGHQGKEAVVGNIKQLVFLSGDIGDVHIMGRRAQLFKLLASEEVDSDQMDLGVTVLASLRGRHIDDLAGSVLDDNEAVLSQSRTLHGEHQRGTGIGTLEGVLLMLSIIVLLRHLEIKGMP